MIPSRLLTMTLLLPTVLTATFPLPSGPFNTTLRTAQLIDHTRLDPYSSVHTPRKLMISIFHPATCTAIATPYMDALTASWTDSQFAPYGIPPGTFESLKMLTCLPSPCFESSVKLKSNPHAPNRLLDDHQENRAYQPKDRAFPLLLFSPGLGNPRLYYSALAQEVASRGYVVVTIDHTYDAGIVVFPDNSSIPAANITSDAQIVEALKVRAADVSFVLNEVSSRVDWAQTWNGKAGVFGHSLGGATAALALRRDGRLVAGGNLDGTFFGSVVNSGLSSPFLLFAHQNKTLSTDPSWAAIWPKLRSFKRLLQVDGSAHGSFTDLPAVIDVLGLRDVLPPEVGQLLGSIGGRRVLQLLGTYLGAFFGIFSKGSGGQLLDGPSRAWPEVVFEKPSA